MKTTEMVRLRWNGPLIMYKAKHCMRPRNVLAALCIILLALMYTYLLYGIIIQFGGFPDLFSNAGWVLPLSLVLFCCLHSLYVLHWKLASLFLLWVVLSTWVLEEIGVASGVLPFGKYEYARHVSHVMVHRVPIDVPLSWYMMLWPSFCIAATIVNEEPHLRGQRRPWPKVVLISVFAAYIMTCWDLLLDPLGSTLSGLWIWKNNGGIYFGVPLLNFFGWFLVSFLIIFLYLVGERFFDVRPVGGGPSSASNGGVPLLINVLPLIAFLCMTLFYVLMSQPVSLCLIAVFVMGVPIIYAGFRLAHSKLAIRTLNSDYELVFDE
ncbi:Carotene biosynthesis protein [Balamuthia mandrillaris]